MSQRILNELLLQVITLNGWSYQPSQWPLTNLLWLKADMYQAIRPDMQPKPFRFLSNSTPNSIKCQVRLLEQCVRTMEVTGSVTYAIVKTKWAYVFMVVKKEFSWLFKVKTKPLEFKSISSEAVPNLIRKYESVKYIYRFNINCNINLNLKFKTDLNSNRWGFGVLGFWGFGVLGFISQ